MSRYIDADALTKEIKQDIIDDGLTERYVFYRINEAPSIDICFCKDCKHSEKTSSPITALWCKRFGLKDMAVEADDFCSYGEREGE